MSNAVLPSLPGLMFPVTKTPMWRTTIQEAASGKETRIGHWSYPRWQYEIGYDFLRSGVVTELQQLAGFFNARRGSFDSWLFSDPDDNSVTLQTIGTGNGVTTQFQTFRTLGGYAEPIRSFVSGTFGYYLNGVLQTSGVSVDTNGVVTFTSAPGVGVLVQFTGQYYWRCRFAEDQIELSKFMKDLWECRSLKFVSLK